MSKWMVGLSQPTAQHRLTVLIPAQQQQVSF
jgi:hypothetical protein